MKTSIDQLVDDPDFYILFLLAILVFLVLTKYGWAA